MIARSITTAVTGGGRYALDAPVAALAGLSVAFLAFAAPADLLEALILSSGLLPLLSDGDPVGLKARIGVGAAGAVIVFAVAFLLLRWLDRFGARPAERAAPVASEIMEAPRLRRRDFHPDAPPRPPLMATYELGEPEPRPLSAEAGMEEVGTAVPPEPAPAAVPAPAVRSSQRPVFDEPESEAPRSIGEKVAPPSAEGQPPLQDGSLTELMARLEQGLARRVPAPPSAPGTPEAPPAPAGTADDRLQSAIASLQRLAARND